MNCREATMLMEKGNERGLTRMERARLWVHYKLCKACQDYGIQSKWIDDLLQQVSSIEPLTEKEKQQLKEEISKAK